MSSSGDDLTVPSVALLNHVLSLQTPAHVAHATVLTTHLERNVVFYARAGFHIVAQRLLVWAMST